MGTSFARREEMDVVCKVPVPEGIRNGDKITLRGEGHHIEGAERGDIKVLVRVRKHRIFERVGADLACKRTITLKEALCGHEFKIEHVSGNTLVVRSLPGEVTHPGCIKRVAEW